ncbi:MAG TPA: histidine kinase [Candidatus Dormibacteraeota bacterium]|jgi:signal transduction histidine kinase|nr:histidine kinase [Candidatus Dormibacteraeota bacterium]
MTPTLQRLDPTRRVERSMDRLIAGLDALPRPHPLLVDGTLTIGLLWVGVVETWPRFIPPAPLFGRYSLIEIFLPVIATAIAVLPLGVRRRFPLAALVGNLAGLLLGMYSGAGGSAAGLAVIVGVFSAALYAADRRRSIAGLAAVLIAVLVMVISQLAGGSLDLAWQLFLGGILVAPWIAGDAIRARTVRARELEERAEILARDRELELAEAAASERGRIARELHDVIAHNLSVMVIQAAAAGRVLDEQPERARESIATVEATGRQALVEMRRLLGVIRREDGDAPRTPQPTLDRLGLLLDDVRAAGLPVELRIEGDVQAMPPGVDVSAYRVIQEALTNTLRHASASTASVVLRYRPGALEIDVLDDGRARPRKRPAGQTGHGLAGMRERMALFHGELEAGPRPEGGFAVRARLPLEPAGT